MYIDSYIFSLGYRQGANSNLADRFRTVGVANDSSYNGLYERFSNIESSDAHVVDNKNEPLNEIQTIELAHAMLVSKPIILLDVPRFISTTNLFLREIILSRLSKIMVCDISILDDSDLKAFLSGLTSKPVNFSLTKHEVALIKSHRRTLFRNLLSQVA